MAYIDSRRTRVYVNPDWRRTDPAPSPPTLTGWELVRGARSDQAQSTPNTQEFYHYGEEAAVSTASPPNRTINVPVSEDLEDEGQGILRWAAHGQETIGLLLLKDGTNGYAVEATVTLSGESGTAQGGLREAAFTITPQGDRVYVGNDGMYDPED